MCVLRSPVPILVRVPKISSVSVFRAVSSLLGSIRAHVVNDPMTQRDLADPSDPMTQRDPVEFNDPSDPVNFNDPTRPSDPARPSDPVLTQPSHMLID